MQRASRRPLDRIFLRGSPQVDVRIRMIETDLLSIHETMSKMMGIEICVLTVRISHIKTTLGPKRWGMVITNTFHANRRV